MCGMPYRSHRISVRSAADGRRPAEAANTATSTSRSAGRNACTDRIFAIIFLPTIQLLEPLNLGPTPRRVVVRLVDDGDKLRHVAHHGKRSTSTGFPNSCDMIGATSAGRPVVKKH